MTNSFQQIDRGAEITFAAVGRAIHQWEGVEAALAIIYSIFVGNRRDSAVIAGFGVCYKITRDRIQAVEDAGARFFVRSPDQGKEGRLRELLDDVVQLSGERHRAGHGRLRALPIPVDNVVSFDAPAGMRYLWGAEIYSADRLRTSWLGVGADEVLLWAYRFEALEKELLTYASNLAPSP